MQRWHLTLGLAASALAAAIVAPSFKGSPAGSGTVLPSIGLGAVSESPDLHEVPSEEAPGRLSLSASLDQAALLEGSSQERFLVLEVAADTVEGSVRQPVHLSVVMDTSGSMAAQGKMSHARAAAQELVGLLGPKDTFSLITFDDHAEVLLPSRSVIDPGLFQRRIQQIQTGGGTNLYDGLSTGLSEVRSDSREGVRRVVLLSDGNANIGVTDAVSLRRTAGAQIKSGVTVSAIGLGIDYNEDLLAAMADAGGGSYRFVDQPGTLTAMFTEELQQLSSVVARQTRLDLDVAEGVEVREIYGYDITQSKDGYSVFLGDMYSGQTRKLVARIHIPAEQPGTVAVVDAAVSHVDADTASAHLTTAHVDAVISVDAALVQSSISKDARKQATKAQVGVLVDAAARDYAKGDLSSNQAQYQEAADLVRAFNGDFEDEEMLESFDSIQEQKADFADSAPASSDGRRQVKRVKESARAYTH